MTFPSDIMFVEGDTLPVSLPTAGKILLYAKTDGNFYSMNDVGVEKQLGDGGGGGGGTVTSVGIVTVPTRLTATGSPITNTGNISLDLAVTSVSAGSYANATITVDAYGRITAASVTPPPTITLTGDVTGSGTGNIATTLATVNSTTGVFGSQTTAPKITVNSKGLITNVSLVNTLPSDLVDLGETLIITTRHQYIIYGTLEVLGTIENNGRIILL